MRLYALFAALQIADALTTLAVLGRGGFESNPLASWFMAAGPVLGLILVKAVVLGIAAGILALGHRRALRMANVAFALVVAWNLSVWVRSL